MKNFKRILSLAVMAALLISSMTFNVSAQVDEKVLFTDDFENWNVQIGSTGVVESELSFEKYYTTSSTGVDELANNNLSQSHIVTETVFNISEWNTTDASSYIATHIRYTDADNNYRLAYYPSSGKLAIASIVNGTETEITSTTIPALVAEKDYTFTLAMCEKSIRAEINGTVYLAFYDSNATLEGGGIAFSTNNQSAVVKSVKADKETKLIHLNFGSGSLFENFTTRKSGGLMYDSTENALKIYRDGTAGIFGICDTYEVANNGYGIRNNPMWENTNLIVRFKRKARGAGGNFYLNSRYVYISEEGAEATLDQYGEANSLVYKGSTEHKTATASTNENFLGDAWHKVELKTMTTDTNTTKVELALDNTLINEITVTDKYRAGGGIQLKTDGYAEVYVSDIVLERVSPETGEPIYTSFYNGFNKGDEAWVQNGDAVGGEFTSNEDELETNLNKCYKTTEETNLPLALNSKEWNNIAVSSEIMADEWVNSEESYAGIAARYVDENNYIMYRYSDYNADDGSKGYVDITEVVNGKATVTTKTAVEKFGADKHTLKLEVKNGMYRGYVDGKIVLAVERPYTNTIGSIALVSNKQAAKFDNIVVNGERDYYYQNFELPFEGTNINTDLKLYTGSGYNTAVYGTDPVTGNGVLTAGSEESTGIYYQSFNTNYTSLSANPWSHIGFNARLKPTTWDGIEIIPRIAGRHSSGQYKLKIEKSGEAYKVYFHRNIDDLVVVTGLLTAADVEYLTPATERVTTDLLTDGEYALICAEAQDNKDGSVTLRAYINGTLITEATDYGPSEAVKTKLASDKPNWHGGVPITASLLAGTATVSVASSKRGVWYLDEVWIEDMSAVETLVPEISVDKEELTANDTVTCTITAVNNTFEEAETELIVALYSENGKLLESVFSKNLTLKPGVSGSESIAVTLPADVAGLKLRAFAWNNLDGIRPLTDDIALPNN